MSTKINQAASSRSNNSSSKKNKKKVPAKNAMVLSNVPVPRENSQYFSNLANAQHDKMVKDYLMALIDPANFSSRIPDGFNRPTAIVKSRTFFDVPIYVDGSENSGRFSCLVQPFLGAVDRPSHYACALVKGNSSWPVEFSTSSSYSAVVGDSDLRLDPNFQTLVTPPPATLYIDGGSSGVSVSLPFGTNPTQSGGYGINYTYDSGSGRFYLPPGMYQISTTMTCTSVTPLTIVLTGSGSVQISNFINNTASAGGVAVINSLISVSGNDGWLYYSTGVSTTFSQVKMLITTAFDDNSLIPTSNAGIITQYRPVALSVLATYRGPTLINGGMISSCYIPGSADLTSFFARQAPSQTGFLQQWESLARLPGAYNGRLEDGTYSWWSPESQEDSFFRAPDAVLWSNYPALVVSGQYNPGDYSGTPYSTTAVVRIQIDRVIELQTTTTLFNMDKLVGSQAVLDRVNQILSSQMHSMQNKTHRNWIASIVNAIKKGANFLWQNRQPLMSAAETLVPLLI